MVSPVVIPVSALAAAFFLGLIPSGLKKLSYVIVLLTLAFMNLCSLNWLWQMMQPGSEALFIHTAGSLPPFSIALMLGLNEAAALSLVSLSGLFAALYLKDTLFKQGRPAMAVLLIFIMSLLGIILTRDLFNLFVFFELSVISIGGLVLLSQDQRALGAGFKYLIASQVVSILMLIGIIFIYHDQGTLNIDQLISMSSAVAAGSSLAFFLIFIAIVVDLKSFPANGWALDIYESAHPSISALISAGVTTAVIFAADKLLMIGGSQWYLVSSYIGIISFIAANILALKQNNDRRMLGYSSVAQTGLLLAVLGQKELLGDNASYILGGLLIAHAVAKAGLFWLSGIINQRDITAWSTLRSKPVLILAFTTFIALLLGLPPFPGFYAKWLLIHQLAADGQITFLLLILFGALLEAGYLFRWFGQVIKRPYLHSDLQYTGYKLFPVLIAFAASWLLAFVWGDHSPYSNLLYSIPLIFALYFAVVDWLPAAIKNLTAIVGMVSWFYLQYPQYNDLQMIFAVIILIGGPLILLASFHAKGQRIGFYPSAMLMYAGLAMLITATDSFSFFAAWELLTIGSYFLILRGKESEPHALSYVVFSLGGAFLILAGFALAAQGNLYMLISELANVGAEYAPWVFIMLAIGFMTKTAAIGLHIWLPGAHAEAETDVSPMVSGILLKAGLFGLMILLMNMGKQQLYGVELTYVMMWIGALSALFGNLLAIFQEDAKRLLAYSSIGQMGYAVFGLAMMNHLGWLMALMFVINHYIYKSMLFLSVGGIAKRTGTKLMYQMGGLITLMPISFVAVLIGIIAVSGVPPLSGFGGRWIFYNAIMTAEYRLPMVIIFLAGPIAFLYLFRLIHTIFLGQLKDEHRRLKEAPFWILVPQVIYIIFLMAFALVPGLALRKVDAYISTFFSNGNLNWQGLTITSEFGYWSPISIMVIIGVIFATLFAWLLFVNRRAQKVKQFNIVYAAERPYRPETTHFAWNFFAPYRKALGFLTQPFVTLFWQTITDLLHSLADFSRRFYTGNGQTYAIQLLAFVVVVYLLKMGV